METSKPKLIIICGLPLAGKTTIARKLARILRIDHKDVDDDIRFPFFGKPQVEADLSPEGKEKERREMLASYEVLICVAEQFLKLGRSVIITATFSREIYWEMIGAVVKRNPNASLKVIQCRIEDDSDDTLWKRIKARGVHTVNSPAHYREVRDRYIDPLPVEHTVLDTSSENAIDRNVKIAAQYIMEGSVS